MSGQSRRSDEKVAMSHVPLLTAFCLLLTAYCSLPSPLAFPNSEVRSG